MVKVSLIHTGREYLGVTVHTQKRQTPPLLYRADYGLQLRINQ